MKLADYVEPMCPSGLIPLTGTHPFVDFQKILGNYLMTEPCFFRLDILKPLLQNLRDIIKRELKKGVDLERLQGLKSHLNGVLRWLSRFSRAKILEKSAHCCSQKRLKTCFSAKLTRSGSNSAFDRRRQMIRFANCTISTTT